MESIRARLGQRRVWLLLIAGLAAGSWYSWSTVAYATSLRVYAVAGGSMSPTLVTGDRFWVEMHPDRPPQRKELWVFGMPKGGVAIKRVIGLPGETVEVSGGRVLIDGVPLAEPYLTTPMTYAMPPIALKSNEFFLLGDVRDASADSHLWGPVPETQLVGRATYRFWPTSRAGGLN